MRLVGLCSETIGVAEGRGRGPTSYWHGYALADCARTFGKSFGVFLSCIFRVANTETNMACSARINGRSCCSTCLLMGDGSGAKPLILRHGGHAAKRGSSGILAASVCTCCMCASRA